MRIIIIGSGIAGLTAAIALRKVGMDVAVYEQAPELREVGAGIGLQANAFVAFNRLGVGNAIRDVALDMEQAELRTDEGHRIRVTASIASLENKMGVRPSGGVAHRAELVTALARFLPAGTAQYGFECVAVEQKGERVAIRFANGHADEADVVIGADGIHSRVRAELFGEQPPRYSGYTCWRGVCPRPASIKPRYFGEWWGRGQRFGICTLTSNRVYWFATHNSPPGRFAADERSMVARLFRGWADPVGELIASTQREGVLRNDIIDRPPTKVWSVGRIGLIGDAAHATTPNLGQGGCLAIEDSVVLARALATNPNPAHALAEFTAQRYRRTAQITKVSWRLGKIGQWEGTMACWLRNRMIGFLFSLLLKAIPLFKRSAFDVGPLPDGKCSERGDSER